MENAALNLSFWLLINLVCIWTRFGISVVRRAGNAVGIGTTAAPTKQRIKVFKTYNQLVLFSFSNASGSREQINHCVACKLVQTEKNGLANISYLHISWTINEHNIYCC